MPSPTEIDFLIQPRWVIPIDPAGVTLEEHAIAVQGDTIVAVCPRDEADARFAPRERLELPDHVVLPGLVNLHSHAAMSLMRGLSDDLPLMRWLTEAIWPTEQRFVSPEFVYDGTLLAACEMMRGGITCTNDMYFFPDASARAFADAGLRAVVGMTLIDVPTPYAVDAEDALHKGLAAFDAWRNHPLIRFAFAPHAPYTVSDGMFERIVGLAHELTLPVHIHVHETTHEIAESLTRYGVRPLERLAQHGVLDTDLIAVHAVHLTPAEIEQLATHNASIAHCPSSNMKLASGMADVANMLQKGLRVGLGTDGAASNNRLDLFSEMRQAALLAKVSTGDAATLPAHAVLRAATLDGARALHLDHLIGAVRPGLQADLVAVDLSAPECSPCYDPAGHLVYTAGREHVSHVWIAGTPCVQGHQMLRQSNNELLRRSRVWQNRLRT